MSLEFCPEWPPAEAADPDRPPRQPSQLPRTRAVLLWYYDHFLCGVCYYFPLLGLFLIPVLLLTGLVGKRYGVQHLFFHDSWRQTLLGGVALGGLWFAILFLAYLLSLRDVREARTGRKAAGDPRASEGNEQLGYFCYFFAILGSLLATGLVFAMVLLLSLGVFGVFDSPPGSDPGFDEDLAGTASSVAAPGASDKATTEEARLADPSRVFPGLGDYSLLGCGVLLAWGILFGVGNLLRLPALECPADWLMTRWSGAVLARWLQSGIWRWTFTLALALSWAWISWQCLRASAGSQWWWRLALLGMGAAATVLVVVRGRAWSGIGNGGRRPVLLLILFAIAVLAQVVFIYAGATWILSNYELGVILALPALGLGVVVLALLTATFVPAYWDLLLARAARRWNSLSGEEKALTRLGLLMLGLCMLAGFLLLGWWTSLASPTPIVMFVLFGVVALYGFFTYLVRRTLILAVGVAFLFALVSHVQPYTMRFPGMESRYARIGLLDGYIDRETRRQDGFDADLTAYAQSLKRARQLDAEREVLEDTLKLETLDPMEQQQLQTRLKEVHKRIEVVRAQRRTIQKSLEQRWSRMEESHRTRAGRFLPIAREALQDLPLLKPRTAGLLNAAELRISPHTEGPAGSGDSGRKRPVVIVAVSGGGIRSAVWVFAVLRRVELALARYGIDFPCHVRIISGASGGMLGAGYYTVTLPPPERRLGDDSLLDARDLTLEEQQRQLSGDFLTPLVRRAALTDLASWLSPWPVKYDRGRSLEEAWSTLVHPETQNAPALGVPVASLRQDEAQGLRPSLIFTPMMVEDGRRLIISNLDLRSAISNDGYVFTHRRRTAQLWDNHSVEAVELFRLLPEVRDSFPVSTSVRMSASFPFFSPAVSLPTRPRRRIVDAGYYDNYGVSLAASWLFTGEAGDYLERNQFDSVLFLQIRDGVTEEDRQLRRCSPSSSLLSRTFEELSSPLEGLLTSWDSASLFRNDGLLEALSQHYNLPEAADYDPSYKAQTFDKIRFLVVNFELEEEVSLSWYLSDRERQAIARAEGKIRPDRPSALQEMIRWWQTPLAVEPLWKRIRAGREKK